jgi:hypothetical protein
MPHIDDGGPAFPRPASEDRTHGTRPPGNATVDAQCGMTIRDYFAAKVIEGAKAKNVTEAKALATSAYQIADAMIAARKT